MTQTPDEKPKTPFIEQLKTMDRQQLEGDIMVAALLKNKFKTKRYRTHL